MTIVQNTTADMNLHKDRGNSKYRIHFFAAGRSWGSVFSRISKYRGFFYWGLSDVSSSYWKKKLKLPKVNCLPHTLKKTTH